MAISRRRENIKNAKDGRGSNPASTKEKKGGVKKDLRSNATIRRLEMYKGKPNMEKMRAEPSEPVRIEPGRKWFNNTRIVTRDNLDQYRETINARKENPRLVLVKRTKLPLSLFDDTAGTPRKRGANLLAIEPFEKTFSSGSRQKKAKLNVTGYADMAAEAAKLEENYVSTMAEAKDQWLSEDMLEVEREAPPEAVLLKGTSKRIWGELYKVVDSSDVILEVLDVRDPLGTRCEYLEKHLKKDRPHKHVVLLLNKCDLVPQWVTEKWLEVLGKEYPTVAFKASIQHPFGKRALIGLLRQYAEMMKNRKHVSVGLIGYPNVGKSSIINTLRGKKVCVSAPIPGETKVWQYVDLTSKVYLIDCPGIVASNDTDAISKVLRGVVRAEKLDCPEDYIESIIDRVGKEKIAKFYKLSQDQWSTASEFLEKLAKLTGKLGKGGEPVTFQVAVKIINDLQRGKLPYFVPPTPSSHAASPVGVEESATHEEEQAA